MSDSTILYSGMFCFGLILLAFILTIREFRQMPRRERPASASEKIPQAGMPPPTAVSLKGRG